MTADLWAPREEFEPDHEAFREAVRTFVSRHVAPNVEAWDDAGLPTFNRYLRDYIASHRGPAAPA